MSQTDRRFGFGRNWQGFLRTINDKRIRLAEESLRAMLEEERLDAKSFLDVGSGSGLFSLAAVRLGAAKVHSFDYDEQSVACTQELKRRYYPKADYWTIEQGNVLERDYMTRLGQYDVVYAWGVLHSTGNMRQALEHAIIPVAARGKLFISIYNDQGWISRYWLQIKRAYNANGFLRIGSILIYWPYFVPLRLLARALTNRLNLERGMSLWYDMKDWLGGYPFEVAKPEAVFDFYRERGFKLVKLKTCGGRAGCNEYVFVKADESSSN